MGNRSQTPFEKIQPGSRQKLQSQGYPWDKGDTPRDIPGTKGKPYNEQLTRNLSSSKEGLASLQTTFGVEVASTASVTSSPPGPGQHQLRTTSGRPAETPKHITHFRSGRRKQRPRNLWGLLVRGGLHLGANPYQKRIRQQDQRDVPVPCRPATNLILIETHVFGVFKILFDPPTRADRFDHLVQRGSRRSKDEVVGFFVRIVHTATNEQPVVPIVFPSVQNRHSSPIEETRPFGSLAHREALPIPGVAQQERFHFPDLYPSALPVRSRYPNWFITCYSQDVGISMFFQPDAQIQITPVDCISHHPRDRDLCLEDPLDHVQGQFTLGLKTNSVGNTSFSTPLWVLCPGKRQGEF